MVAKVALSLIVFAVSAVAFTWDTPSIVHVREDAMLTLAPSAQRAYEYGNRHFSALTSEEYDVARAKELYFVAARKNPDHPGLQHQLARIDFLEGNYVRGLKRINREIRMHGEENPNALYVKALLLGFNGRYGKAAAVYEKYFSMTPANWGAINDYSWVLLKADQPELALEALEWGLSQWPESPWLLHNKAIALYELRRYEEAADAAHGASRGITALTEEDWLLAYPGNDPMLAPEGLNSFRNAVLGNQVKILERLAQED